MATTTTMDAERARLIEEHMPLVEHVVRRVASSFPAHVDRSELMSAGRLGLTEAASGFDLDRGVPFAPYAARRIRGSVLDHLRRHDWVPRSERERARTDEQVERTVATRGRLASLDEPGTERGVTDRVADRTIPTAEEVLENRELHGYLRAALDSLPERLRLIVVGHYLEGRPLDELAVTLGVTPSRVSQLRSHAIDVLRHGLESQFHDEAAAELPLERPKGRVEIRQAQFAASVARHSDWRARLAGRRYMNTSSVAGADAGSEQTRSA